MTPNVPITNATAGRSEFDTGLPLEPPAFRLYLICQGMMMFHWEPLNDEHRIRILMTELPEAHETLLSTRLGGWDENQNVESFFESSPFFDLQLTTTFQHGKGFKPDPDKDLVLDSGARPPSKPGGQAMPAGPFRLDRPSPLVPNGQNLTHGLQVPYPTDVLRGLVLKRDDGTAPFHGGPAASDFRAAPKEIAAMRIFVYEEVLSAKLVSDQGTHDLSPTDGILKLYLYSQENEDLTGKNVSHLPAFKGLADYSVLVPKKVGGFRLFAPEIRPVELVESPNVDKSKGNFFVYGDFDRDNMDNWPPGLAKSDFWPLFIARGGDPKLIGGKVNAPPTDDEVQQAADPVNCLQGWGT